MTSRVSPRAGQVRALRLARALAVALLLGLPGAPAHAQAGAPPPARSAAGTWAGRIAAPTGRIDLIFQLQQEGERVYGTYDYRGPLLVALNVRVTGSLRGDTLTLFEEGASAPVLDARVEGRALTGLFRGSGSPGRLDAARVD